MKRINALSGKFGHELTVVASLMLCVSVVQVVLATAAYNMTNWVVGTWWGGFSCFVVALCAMFPRNMNIQKFGLFAAIISMMVVVVGFVRDGVMATYLRELDTCYDQRTGDIYGQDGNTIQAVNCAVGHGQRCLCVDSEERDTCYLFEKKITDNCGDILSAMPGLLISSVVFQILLFGIVLYYSVQVCIVLCCPPPPPTPYGSRENTGRHSGRSGEHTGRFTGRHTGRHSGHRGIDHGPNHSYRSQHSRRSNASTHIPAGAEPVTGPLAAQQEQHEQEQLQQEVHQQERRQRELQQLEIEHIEQTQHDHEQDQDPESVYYMV